MEQLVDRLRCRRCRRGPATVDLRQDGPEGEVAAQVRIFGTRRAFSAGGAVEELMAASRPPRAYTGNPPETPHRKPSKSTGQRPCVSPYRKQFVRLA